VKFHFKTAQGIRNFTNGEAAQMKANDMGFSQRDLMETSTPEIFRNGI
jgi:catalase